MKDIDPPSYEIMAWDYSRLTDFCMNACDFGWTLRWHCSDYIFIFICTILTHYSKLLYGSLGKCCTL